MMIIQDVHPFDMQSAIWHCCNIRRFDFAFIEITTTVLNHTLVIVLEASLVHFIWASVKLQTSVRCNLRTIVSITS